MKFVNYQYLLFLFLIPVLFFIGISGIKNFIKRRNQIINSGNFVKLGLENNTGEKFLSVFLWLAIITMTVIGLSRPIGGEIFTETEDNGKDIVIALDISDSMKARDVTLSGSYSEFGVRDDLKDLSRLEAAKKVIKGFVRNLEGDKVSLIAFADSAFPLFPMSNDYETFYSYLANVDYSYINEGGTDISNALNVAEKRFFNKEKSKIIVIVSDGEEQNDKAIEKTKDLYKKGIKIITIGIGSRQGSKIYLGKSIYDENLYKTYLGQDVITKLNDQVLKDIAKQSDGKYLELGNENISDNISNFINNQKQNNTVSTKKIKVYDELFQGFTLIALLLIICEIAFKRLSFLHKNT